MGRMKLSVGTGRKLHDFGSIKCVGRAKTRLYTFMIGRQFDYLLIARSTLPKHPFNDDNHANLQMNSPWNTFVARSLTSIDTQLTITYVSLDPIKYKFITSAVQPSLKIFLILAC